MKKWKFLFFASVLAGTASLAPASTVFDSSLGSPGFYNGTGNSNSGFTVLTANNSDGSVLELGLSAIERFVGPITPSGVDYTVPTGTASSDALWDFEFSVNVEGPGSTFSGETLSDYTYSLTMLDLNNASNSFSFSPTLLPDNAQYNSNSGMVVCNGCAYDGSNTGMQNAENLSFFSTELPGFNPNSTDSWLITLAADPVSGTAADPSVSIIVNPTATPEPATLGLMIAGMAGIGFWRRKKTRAQS